MNIRQIIYERLNEIQLMMESQNHLQSDVTVSTMIDSISKFWSLLSEEDRDFISAARIAIKERFVWNSDGD